jgi:hypothetical protein
VGQQSGRLWRIADGIMLVLFLFSVVVQFNDPDPLRWVGIYGLAAVACAASLARTIRWWLPTVVTSVALVWAATLAPGVIGKVRFLDMFGAFEMKSVAVEEAREMYGLVLVAAWMVVLAVRARTSARPTPPAPPQFPADAPPAQPRP